MKKDFERKRETDTVRAEDAQSKEALQRKKFNGQSC